MGSETRQKWWTRPLGHIVWLLMTLVCATLRRRVDEKSAFLKKNQAIVALWHNRIFVPCFVYRYVLRGEVPMSMLTSASKDGTMLTTVARDYGMRTVRGSSRRRGAAGFLDMMRELREGCSMCITPDGPKGPRYRCHPGVIKLASMSGVPIVPLRIKYSCAYRVRSWDRFFIPMPFSRVELSTTAEPLCVPPDLSEEELAAWCARLEEALGTE
ncbi:MAG: lysophospholipid acyltransferase family protein [Akkermansiaceae bacterium]|nr:lysophospholipid acyltransferase family protein [Akkermansiaceae bacterium]